MTEQEKKRFYEQLGLKIREFRISANLKQEAFASYLKLSRASIVNIEKGRQHPPIHLLWQIAKILGTEIHLLMPEITSSEKVNSDWVKIITLNSKGDQQTKRKLLSFVGEIKSSKNL